MRSVLSEERFGYLLEIMERMGQHRVEIIRMRLSSWTKRLGTTADRCESESPSYPESAWCIELGHSFRSSSQKLEFSTSSRIHTPGSLRRGESKTLGVACFNPLWSCNFILLDMFLDQLVEGSNVGRFFDFSSSLAVISFYLETRLIGLVVKVVFVEGTSIWSALGL